MSLIVETWKPTACNARRALSRPEPGPLTSISNVSMPCSRAFLPASSAATWAAYGVLLRLPLKPWLPADDHAIALPWASVMVITVLLNVAATCATPAIMFLRSLRRGRAAAAGFAMFFDPASTTNRAGDRHGITFPKYPHQKPARHSDSTSRPPQGRSQGKPVRLLYLVTFFLPAIATALPLRVRALVWVR